MEIPLFVKRRYSEILRQVDYMLKTQLNNYYQNISQSLESFIQAACTALSTWMEPLKSGITFDDYKKYFLYLFRTKISVYWENKFNPSL